ncbi:hypothetical protein Ocin01_02541 [Orchesella cincta]|uniref:Uncharacterized protein n=1 Tax=Orchesella cincta TaxID=48709 RepID=A0A1D2NFY1_ORCCI|nr:hypothetical protein Ocin01_02541 [Orchesella cincta]
MLGLVTASASLTNFIKLFSMICCYADDERFHKNNVWKIVAIIGRTKKCLYILHGPTITILGMELQRRNSEDNTSPRARRSSIVVIPPMQICPGDLLVYGKCLSQRKSLLGMFTRFPIFGFRLCHKLVLFIFHLKHTGLYMQIRGGFRNKLACIIISTLCIEST